MQINSETALMRHCYTKIWIPSGILGGQSLVNNRLPVLRMDVVMIKT